MTEIPQDATETIVSLAKLVHAEREAMAKEIVMLRADNAAAWDKCEERRLEAAAAYAALATVKEALLHNDPYRLGPILRTIDATLSKAEVRPRCLQRNDDPLA